MFSMNTSENRPNASCFYTQLPKFIELKYTRTPSSLRRFGVMSDRSSHCGNMHFVVDLFGTHDLDLDLDDDFHLLT